MRRISLAFLCSIISILLIPATTVLHAQSKPMANKEEAPLRVALAGLVHGHASGFFGQFLKRTDLQIVGIAESDVNGRKSLGLLGMHERALLFGGEVSITGAPGHGTRVAVVIPTRNRA